MYVTLRDLFWIQSVIPFHLRQRINTILCETDEGLGRVLRDLLTNAKQATQIALIVIVVELSIEHPDREKALLKSAESLMIRPLRYRKLLRDFRYQLLRTMNWETEEKEEDGPFYL